MVKLKFWQSRLIFAHWHRNIHKDQTKDCCTHTDINSIYIARKRGKKDQHFSHDAFVSKQYPKHAVCRNTKINVFARSHTHTIRSVCVAPHTCGVCGGNGIFWWMWNVCGNKRQWNRSKITIIELPERQQQQRDTTECECLCRVMSVFACVWHWRRWLMNK